jgi:hypothetical protein
VIDEKRIDNDNLVALCSKIGEEGKWYEAVDLFFMILDKYATFCVTHKEA